MTHKTIDDLLLPGTPEEVRERYRSLEERAHEMSFDLLEHLLHLLLRDGFGKFLDATNHTEQSCQNHYNR